MFYEKSEEFSLQESLFGVLLNLGDQRWLGSPPTHTHTVPLGLSPQNIFDKRTTSESVSFSVVAVVDATESPSEELKLMQDQWAALILADLGEFKSNILRSGK